MKKMRDYPLCGPRESRYNDPCEMGRRVATVMTPQRMSRQGVTPTAEIRGNQMWQPRRRQPRGSTQTLTAQ